MTADDDRFADWIAGLRDGDPLVLQRFFAEFHPALERLAASRIDPGLRRRVGPESIAQSVCRTFLRRAKAGQFEIVDRDALWGLLLSIALTKVREKVRFHGREKRAAGREVPVERSSAVTDGSPGPDEQAVFADELEHIFATLSDEERAIVDLRLADMSQSAIAAEMGVSERTVRRLMGRLEDRLRASLADR